MNKIRSSIANTKNLGKYALIDKTTIDRGINIRLDNPADRKYLFIGENNVINSSFIFESKEGEVHIGNNCCILGSTFISHTSIIIGNYVHIAWGTYLYDHDSHSPNPL